MSTIPPKEHAAVTGLTVIINLIVSLCKQGTISTQFAEKVRSATQKDIGRSVKLTLPYVGGIWGAYGQFINETNIEPLMNHFLEHVMGEAIRLRVTIMQSKYQALTMYQTIGRAILTFPLLSWHLVEKFAPGELSRYSAAIDTVGRNGYYGYSKALDKVKSANFRHLGYLAKELLVKVNGETNLNDNRVFEVKPARYALIDKIVTMYIDNVAAEGEAVVFGGNTVVSAVYRTPITGIALEIINKISLLASEFSL